MSLERRDRIIEELLMALQVGSGFDVTDEQLDRYESWLLLQSDVVLQNKLLMSC